MARWAKNSGSSLFKYKVLKEPENVPFIVSSCHLYTGLNCIHYSLMGKMRLPLDRQWFVIHIQVSFNIGLTVYHILVKCFPSFIVRWILNFVDQPTHENHENWYPTNKSDFTVFANFSIQIRAVLLLCKSFFFLTTESWNIAFSFDTKFLFYWNIHENSE